MKLLPLLGQRIHLVSLPARDAILLERSILLLDPAAVEVYGVPAGFECDGESVPGILPETAAGDAGGVVHDFLYRFAFVYVWLPREQLWSKRPVSRAWADAVYRATCIAFTGWGWWARVKWAALRYSGPPLLVWQRHRRAGRVWPGPEPETPPVSAGS